MSAGIVLAQNSTDHRRIFQEVRSQLESLDNFSVNVVEMADRQDLKDLKKSAELRIVVDRKNVFIEGVQGLLFDQNRPFRLFLDGKQVFIYADKTAAVNSYDCPHKPKYGDPRLYSVGCWELDSFENIFAYLESYKKLVSQTSEMLNGIRVRRFVLENEGDPPRPEMGSQIVLLVDDQNRVWNYEYISAHGPFSRTESFYDDNFAEGRFPKKVKNAYWWEIDKVSGPPHSSSEVIFSDFRTGEKLPENGWEAIQPEVGAPVVDIRIRERLGYWNADKSLSEYSPVTKDERIVSSIEPANSKPGNRQGVGFWIFVSIGVTTLALALLLWYRGRDQKS
ncbi:MAG: hypothetical protein KF851_04045 [Pirellulaceae bacterium]|nr:hypothetical protein [Pirellulaceae bacterium]